MESKGFKILQNKIELAELRKLIKKKIRKDVKNFEEELIVQHLTNSVSIKEIKKDLNEGNYWITDLNKDNLEEARTRK